MLNIKILFSILVFITTISFGATIKEGPEYIKDRHYIVGQNKLVDGTNYGREYKLRFWVNSNFGTDLEASQLKKIAGKTAKLAKKVSKTHIASQWYWSKINNNEAFMMGYYDDLSGEFAHIPVKRVGKQKWRYSCNGESWFLIRDGDYDYCEAKKGGDVIKFEFFIPSIEKGWSGDEMMYRFSISKD